MSRSSASVCVCQRIASPVAQDAVLRVPRELRAQRGLGWITQQELDDLNLKETVVTCRRGTFAMADVFGFHRRMRSARPQRLGLHTNLSNPFFSHR